MAAQMREISQGPTPRWCTVENPWLLRERERITFLHGSACWHGYCSLWSHGTSSTNSFCILCLWVSSFLLEVGYLVSAVLSCIGNLWVQGIPLHGTFSEPKWRSLKDQHPYYRQDMQFSVPQELSELPEVLSTMLYRIKLFWFLFFSIYSHSPRLFLQNRWQIQKWYFKDYHYIFKDISKACIYILVIRPSILS